MQELITGKTGGGVANDLPQPDNARFAMWEQSGGTLAVPTPQILTLNDLLSFTGSVFGADPSDAMLLPGSAPLNVGLSTRAAVEITNHTFAGGGPRAVFGTQFIDPKLTTVVKFTLTLAVGSDPNNDTDWWMGLSTDITGAITPDSIPFANAILVGAHLVGGGSTNIFLRCKNFAGETLVDTGIDAAVQSFPATRKTCYLLIQAGKVSLFVDGIAAAVCITHVPQTTPLALCCTGVNHNAISNTPSQMLFEYMYSQAATSGPQTPPPS